MRLSMPEPKPTQPPLTSAPATSSVNSPPPVPPVLDASLSIDPDDGEGGGGAGGGGCGGAGYRCGRIAWRLFTSQLGLVALLLCYSFAGAAIFKAIEAPNELQVIDDMESFRRTLLDRVYELAQRKNATGHFERDAGVLLAAFEERLTRMINHGISSGHDNIVWDYWGSLFYCATIFTTIGYGHITPGTSWGRVATMIYAIIGIPLFLVIMGKFGMHLTAGLKFVWRYVRRCYYARCCRLLRSRLNHSPPVQCVRHKLACCHPASSPQQQQQQRMSGTSLATATVTATDVTRPPSDLSHSKHARVIEQVRRVSSQAALAGDGVGDGVGGWDGEDRGADGDGGGHERGSGIGGWVSNSVERTNITSIVSTSSQDLIRSVASECDSLDDFQLDDDFKLPPLLAFAISAIYIFAGAFMYTRWEPWTYLEAFYFLFVSVSTIGFGDLIPKHPKYFLASSAYIVLGLALVAMMINVLIEFFNKTIDLAKEKVADVGRHMGLDVDDFEHGGSGRSRASSFAAANSPRRHRSPDAPRSPGHASRSPGHAPRSPGHAPRSTGHAPRSPGHAPRSPGHAPRSHDSPTNSDKPKRNRPRHRKRKSEVDLATPASVHASDSCNKSHRRSSKNLERSNTQDPCAPTKDTQGPTQDPCAPTKDAQGPTRDPQGLTEDPQGPTKDPQGPTRDPQGLTKDPQGLTNPGFQTDAVDRTENDNTCTTGTQSLSNV